MNWYAAQELKIPFPNQKGLIMVWSGQSNKEQKQTITHEKSEIFRMSKKGEDYAVAHNKSPHADPITPENEYEEVSFTW
jgi:hypothetical protein